MLQVDVSVCTEPPGSNQTAAFVNHSKRPVARRSSRSVVASAPRPKATSWIFSSRPDNWIPRPGTGQRGRPVSTGPEQGVTETVPSAEKSPS